MMDGVEKLTFLPLHGLIDLQKNTFQSRKFHFVVLPILISKYQHIVFICKRLSIETVIAYMKFVIDCILRFQTNIYETSPRIFSLPGQTARVAVAKAHAVLRLLGDGLFRRVQLPL